MEALHSETCARIKVTQIGDSNFVNGLCTSLTKGEIFNTQLFGEMKLHLKLMAQLIGKIVCTGCENPNIVD